MDPNMTLEIADARSLRYFFKGQLFHLVALLILTAVAWAFAAPALGDGSWLGVADATWFWLALGLAMLQQILVWLVFRAQLGWGFLTRVFGHADMIVWGLAFLPLLVARPVLILGLAFSDQGSLLLPRYIAIFLGAILLIPALYALWSVPRYFGLARALGGDHFRLRYRQMPLVKEGAFRLSGNAMYSFVFLGLWSIALLVGSQAALSAALFEHAYVWVHYYATEEPDMALLYSTDEP